MWLVTVYNPYELCTHEFTEHADAIFYYELYVRGGADRVVLSTVVAESNVKTKTHQRVMESVDQ